MKRKMIAIGVGCVLLAVCGMTLAQNASTPVPSPGSYGTAHGNQPITFPNGLPISNVQSVKTDPKPDDLTIDQILDTVENIREQKAELEKKEKLYLKALNRKTEKLKERIERVQGDTSAGQNDSSTPPPTYIPSSPMPPSPNVPPNGVPVAPNSRSVQ